MALPKLLMPSPLSQRLTLLVALSHLVLGGFVLYSGLSAGSAEVAGQDALVPLKLYAGAAILLLGIIFLLIELEQRWAAWVATLPALTSLVLLLEAALKRSLGAGPLLQTLAGGNATPDAHMPTLLSSALLAASVAILTTLPARFSERLRSPLIALMGSPFQAIGFAILLGAATQIPLVYDLKTPVVTAVVTGATLLVTSLGLGMLAWRDSYRANPAAPVWVPLPVVVVAVTFTLIIATGFRSREAEFYRSSAQNQINLVASTINADLERIINSFGRAARRWSESNETIDTTRVRQLVSQMEDIPGRHTLAVLDASRKTLFGATSESNGKRVDIPINHDLDPVRSETLDESSRSLEPGLTGTLLLGEPGLGFAVYAPLVRDGKATGYVAGDFSYRAFFNAIERRLKLSGTHHSTILVGNERVFDGDGGAIGRTDVEALV